MQIMCTQIMWLLIIITLCSSKKCSTDTPGSVQASLRIICCPLQDLVQVRLTSGGHVVRGSGRGSLWSGLPLVGVSQREPPRADRDSSEEILNVGWVQWMSSLLCQVFRRMRVFWSLRSCWFWGLVSQLGLGFIKCHNWIIAEIK